MKIAPFSSLDGGGVAQLTLTSPYDANSWVAGDGRVGLVTSAPGEKSQGRFSMAPTLRRPAKELGPRANLTIARILDATKRIFLMRGYAGTTIDEVTRVATVSRASFYTYFPSKRDVLLALGKDSLVAGRAAIDRLRVEAPGGIDEVLVDFVHAYFKMLDEHGSFAFAWTQAAHEDEEIRLAGMKGHLDMCRRLGVALGSLRGEPFEDPAEQGLVTVSMMERTWAYCQLYIETIDQDVVEQDIAHMLAATLNATLK
jgi:TetR/AcrR family transcriptional regulator